MMRLKGDFLDAGVNMSLDNDNHVECVTLLQRENTRNFLNLGILSDIYCFPKATGKEQPNQDSVRKRQLPKSKEGYLRKERCWIY